MTIKTVSTWAKTLETYIPASIEELKQCDHMTAEMKAAFLAHIESGVLSATTLPEESIVETDAGLVITLVWSDATLAQEFLDTFVKLDVAPGLISREVVVS